MFWRGQNLRIGLEAAVDESWMGGVIYLKNLLSCLASLSKRERPEIEILFADPSSEIALHARSLGIMPPPDPSSASMIMSKVRKMFSKPEAIEKRGIDVSYPGFAGPI